MHVFINIKDVRSTVFIDPWIVDILPSQTGIDILDPPVAGVPKTEGGHDVPRTGKKKVLPTLLIKLVHRIKPSIPVTVVRGTIPTMASVYKSISKKEKKKKDHRPVEEEDEDVVMENGIDDTSDSEEEEEGEQEEQEDGKLLSASGSGSGQQQTQNKSGLMPKTRVLMLTSRGVTYR